MEGSKKHLERLQAELKKRYDSLQTILDGEVFTTKDKTPWLHCMDNTRREQNRFINKMDLSLSINDFDAIIKEIKKMK